ncbi:hypothetical protein GMDG_04252 [Pseudogymnoascus destructans 20631-21]|uniref:BZIP domain-containing protein n=1 Tax=Pseudogymnoascus destructans (strain ATCC MYA-4855 / 20631-21) TaxID=658429 RepID=L8GAU3_PSED2|nr:hypothetical protein GMDG_04252 [Pseudogymnoascus destructans 20631-21]
MAYPTPINEPFGTTAIAATLLPTDGLSNSSGLRALPASGNSRRHSASPLSAPSLQNQRVAAIIQGTGHQISSPAFTNRYNPFAQHQQFYALSAPSSSAALQSQIRTRPHVPLFSQSTSTNMQSFPPTNMAQDMNLFDDFDSFDLKSSDNVNFPDLDYKYSPAVPTMYSPAPAMNRTDSASTSMGTVSPQDLMVRDATFSAPNSTVFTNLTSPSQYNESPDYLHDLDVSPMYNSDDLNGGDPWFPLFPEGDVSFPAPVAADTSPLAADEELEVGDALRERRRRSDSSPHSKAASAAAGVSARKRNQPLPPIVVEDPNDTVAIKRARNTLAARKSRQKKMERFDELEAEIARIASERDMWKAKALARGAN